MIRRRNRKKETSADTMVPLVVYFSNEEYEELCSAAEARSMGINEFIRRAAHTLALLTRAERTQETTYEQIAERRFCHEKK